MTRLVIGPTGSSYGTPLFTGAITLLGALSYISILGDVRRIEIDRALVRSISLQQVDDRVGYHVLMLFA